MKRIDLIKQIKKSGCILIRHGGRHDWYQNPITKTCQPIPRHREINPAVCDTCPLSAKSKQLCARV